MIDRGWVGVVVESGCKPIYNDQKQYFLDLTTTKYGICTFTIVGIPSTYLKFSHFACILHVSVLLLYQPRYNYIPHRFRAFLGSKGIFLLSSTPTRLLTRIGLIHMLGAIALLNFVYDGFLAHPWHEKLK